MPNDMAATGLAPGTLIGGKFRLMHQVGEGAMGAVWAARNEVTSGAVAIKLLLQPDTELRQRLQREARAGALLKHRHILDVYDMGETVTGEPFLVMQLLSGETLASVLKQKRRLDPSEAAAIGRDIARALSAAHAVKIVHRDLKPANVYLHREPGEDEPVVKVLDFGVAKDLSSSDSLRTALGSVVGSLYYLSPEQARAQPDIDHRADIWALGVVLFEMLTGVRPFQGDASQVFASVLNGEIPSISRHLRRVDEGLVRLVDSCLRRDRDERVGSAAELVKALHAFTSGGEGARAPAEAARAALPSQPEALEGLQGDGPTVVLAPRQSAPVIQAGLPPVDTITEPLRDVDPAMMPVRGGTIQLPDAVGAKVRAALEEAVATAKLVPAERGASGSRDSAAEVVPVARSKDAAADDSGRAGRRGKRSLAVIATGVVVGLGLCAAGAAILMPRSAAEAPPRGNEVATQREQQEAAPAEPQASAEATPVAPAPPSATSAPEAPEPEPASSASVGPTASAVVSDRPRPALGQPEKDPCVEQKLLLRRKCRDDAARAAEKATYD